MFHVKHTEKPKLLVITGPTASGKTKLAVSMARQFDGEIISADSRQVFRGMNLGTGKDIGEYGEIPYHLIDILNPAEGFSASQFKTLALSAIEQTFSRQKLPILCGGSGHYIKSLLQGYQFNHPPHNPYFSAALEGLPTDFLKTCAKRLGLNGPTDSNRRMARSIEKALTAPTEQPLSPSSPVKFDAKVYLIQPERSLLRLRIRQRLRERLQEGMVEEVQSLLDQHIPIERLQSFGLEYRWVTAYLQKELSLTAMEKSLFQNICQFAKRQETFFRYMQKEGVLMRPFTTEEEMSDEVHRWLQRD